MPVLNLRDMQQDAKDKISNVETAEKKPMNRKAVAAVGGLGLVLLITVGVILGTQRTQETYNGSRDILRMLETAPGLKITLYTTGVYADDGMFQQTDIVIVPKDFSKSKTELVFDAKAQFQVGNTTITYIVKDSRVYTTEETNGTIESYCAKAPDLPNFDAIIDTILNGQVIQEDSAFYQKLQCPKPSQRLIHAVWEGLDYFYCFDNSGPDLGSFSGPAMIGRVEYLSDQETIEISAPEDLVCEIIDIQSLFQPPVDLLNLNESKRRLQSSTTCQHGKARFGQCEYCVDSGAVRNRAWALTSSAFSKLDLDFTNFFDLPQPTMSPTQIHIRKLRSGSEYKLEHDGFPCVYVHGAGIQSNGPLLLDSLDSYWGSSTRTDKPCFCSSVHYVKLNTLTRNYQDRVLQQELAALLLTFRTGTFQSRIILDQVTVITHGTGGLILAGAISNGLLDFHETSRWFSLNTPRSGTHLPQYMKEHCPDRSFEELMRRISSFTCQSIHEAGFESSRVFPNVKQAYDQHVTQAACGVSVSRSGELEGQFLSKTTSASAGTSHMKIMSDGMTRVGSCFEDDSKYVILRMSYWDSQMKRADSITGGVRTWLHALSSDFASVISSPPR